MTQRLSAAPVRALASLADRSFPTQISNNFAPANANVAAWPRPIATTTRAAVTSWVNIAAALLLVAYAVMAWTASLGKGVSFDEGVQLAVGYNEWLHGDYRIEGANGDLVKRWATLPYLVSRPRFLGTTEPLWQRADSYEFGRRFLFELGNSPEWLLAQGRAMVTLLGVAAGWLVFRCGGGLFGDAGGLVALALFVFSPHMLAFGGIVSTDMSIVLTLFGATWCIWRLLHEVTLPRVLASVACFGLLLLAKMTAVVIFPLTAVMIATRCWVNRPIMLRWRCQNWTFRARRAQAAIVSALILVHAVAGWAAIWTHYGFRYSATPPASGLPAALPPQTYADGRPGLPALFVDFTRRHHLLPEGYCRGVEWLLGSDDKLPAFMHGRAKLGGWREFFPYAIWVKTPPALFALVAFGAWAWWRARRRDAGGDRRPLIVPSLYEASPFVALVIVYLAVAASREINLGHRHVLPIYPALYVLAGAVVLAWRPHAPAQ